VTIYARIRHFDTGTVIDGPGGELHGICMRYSFSLADLYYGSINLRVRKSNAYFPIRKIDSLFRCSIVWDVRSCTDLHVIDKQHICVIESQRAFFLTTITPYDPDLPSPTFN
jgi:hypothetical protein